MISSKNRISRRSILRGAGHCLHRTAFPRGDASSASEPRSHHDPHCVLVFYTPGGTLLDKPRPTGTETNYVLGDMMSSSIPTKTG